jgi:hypothetical protein
VGRPRGRPQTGYALAYFPSLLKITPDQLARYEMLRGLLGLNGLIRA